MLNAFDESIGLMIVIAQASKAIYPQNAAGDSKNSSESGNGFGFGRMKSRAAAQ